MKIKDFLEWFSGIDPESELKFDLFEEIINGNGDCTERWSRLFAEDLDYVDEDGNTHLTFVWLDWEVKEWTIKVLEN